MTHRSTPTVAAHSSQKSILSDTSLAVVERGNGDRRLFFQEQSGTIRQGLYSASSQKWSADSDFIVASDARNNTPLAAVNTSLLDSLPTVSFIANNDAWSD